MDTTATDRINLKETPIDKIYLVPTTSAVQQQAQTSFNPAFSTQQQQQRKMSRPKKVTGQSSALM